MKQVEFPKFKRYANQLVKYIQPKLDGHLTKIHMPERSIDVKTYTKNDKDITGKLFNIPHIRHTLMKLPSWSTIFAELHYPDGFSTDVPTMLNNADGRLQLTAFAAPMLDGDDLANAGLSGVMLLLQDIGFKVSYTRILNEMKSMTEYEKQLLLDIGISNKLEGYVLKEGHMTGWYKLKPVRELDAFVISTQQSFSDQHYGGLKGIQVGVFDSTDKIVDLGNVGSGFEAEYRATLDTKEKRDTLVDRVCEVQYDSITSQGSLRFPRFVRWREDKDKKDCTTEQIEN